MIESKIQFDKFPFYDRRALDWLCHTVSNSTTENSTEYLKRQALVMVKSDLFSSEFRFTLMKRMFKFTTERLFQSHSFHTQNQKEDVYWQLASFFLNIFFRL